MGFFDFLKATVDRTGGASVRSSARLSANLLSPFVHDARKNTESFIKRNLENNSDTQNNKVYNEQSRGGRAGRVVGTGASAAAQVGTAIAATVASGGTAAPAEVEAGVTAAKGARVLSFLKEAGTATAIGAAQQVGQGNSAAGAVQAGPRGITQLGQSIAGKPTTVQNTRLGKQILGSEPVQSLQEQYKTTKERQGTVSAVAQTGLALGTDLLLAKGAYEGAKGVTSLPKLSEVAESNASKASGLKSAQVINENEAGTLRDYASYKMGDYKPKPSVINELDRQARNAADTAGVDITSGSAREIADRIETYISQRSQHLETRMAAAEGGYVKFTGDDAESLAKKDTVGEIKKQLDGKLPAEKVDAVTSAITRTNDPNVVMNIVDNANKAVDVIKPPTIVPETPIAPVVEPLGIREATVPKSGESILGNTALTAASKDKAPLPTPAADPFDEILGAVNGKGEKPTGRTLSEARAEQDALLAKERGARFNSVAEARKNATGEDAYFKRRAALKGEYSKVDYKPLVGDIGEARAKQLFEDAQAKIYSTPDSVYEDIGLHPEAARFNTEVAVRKVLGFEPGLPTKSEIRLLSLQSKKIAAEVEAAIPKQRKIFDAASAIFGSIRGAKSSLDFSMGGRQGLFVAVRHAREWAFANKESVKFATDSKYYKATMKELHEDEWGKFIDNHDRSVLTGGASHEEAYAGSDLLTSDTAKKVGVGHLIDGSERAYTGGLTVLRKSILVKAMKSYGATPAEVEAALGKQGVDGLIETVRTLTGRGGKSGGWVDKHATTLQEALFSPRLWASRLEPLNPAFWKRIGPAGRREAMQSLGSFAAVAGVVLSAAVAAGAEVETDPRSSDFLKIKVGDTRYDILGGFQQNLVFGARQGLGLSNTLLKTDFNTTKNSTTGAMSKYGDRGGPNQLSAAFDLVRNKANPVLGAAANIIEGKDKAYNAVNPLTEIAQLFVPISLQSAFNARKDPKDILKGLPDLVGIGSQTYGIKDVNITDKQKATLKILEQNGAPKEKVEAYKSFYQTQKIAAGKRTNANAAVTEALAAGDTERAKKIAADYNKRYAASFKEWLSKYKQYDDKTLTKEYNANKIKLTAASTKTRIKAIKANPLYQVTLGGK